VEDGVNGRKRMLPETRAHVEAARGGDPEAFGELVNRYRGPICGFVYSIVEDYHLAQDISQDVFFLALRRIEALRDPESFPTWLFRIAYRHSLNLIRERERQAKLLKQAGSERFGAREVREGSASFDPQWVERAGERERVENALATIKEEWTAVLVPRYFEGLTCKEIAQALEIGEENVRVRLHRGRLELRRRLKS
jgi:RNA polymerase sigma-70 factor, ECF subfamily